MPDDLISKRALLKKTRRMYAPDEIDSMAPVATSCVTVDDIHRAAVVDAAPVVHGRWMWEGRFKACSECGTYIDWDNTLGANHWRYCPNCGAKMDGGAEG